MKEKILEIQNYFADKLARGLYKVVRAEENYITVKVDKKYTFSLWLSSGLNYFSVWNEYFIKVIFTEAQLKQGYKIAMKHRDEHWVDETEKKELEELKRLREKYLDIK